MDQLNLYTWVKDAKFRFVSCSENLSELAGADSPSGMAGKDDYSLIWRDNAEFFRGKDLQIVRNEIKYINIIETIDVVVNEAIQKQRILITKAPVFNRKGKCVGIAGSHIDLPPEYNKPEPGSSLDDKGRFWLPKSLGSEYLTKREINVLKYILLGKTSKQIAKIFSISHRTVEEHTEKIKRKLQCSSKQEIHSVAIEHGLTHII